MFRSPFRGDLVELGDKETRQILREGGTILGRDTAVVGNVPGEVLRSRGVSGSLRLTYLAVVDGVRWAFRMEVSSGEVAVADAPSVEASAVRSFQRMIRSVTIA